MTPETGQILYPCIIKGCNETGVCLDFNNYTQKQAGIVLDLFADDEALEDAANLDPEISREVWYCNEHAIKYLFPIIDVVAGNTSFHILRDFVEEGIM